MLNHNTPSSATGGSWALFVGAGKGHPLRPWTPGDAGSPTYGDRDALQQFLPKAGQCANRGCSQQKYFFIDKRKAGRFRWRTTGLCLRCQHLRDAHGMSLADLVALWRSQKMKCYSCGVKLADPRQGSRAGRIDIDHDHSIHDAEKHSCSACIRGLSCHKCNITILSNRWQKRELAAA